MTKANDYNSVMSRKAEIMLKSVGIDYSKFESGSIAFDYEKMMRETGYTLEEMKSIQYGVNVGNTPVLELKNLTPLSSDIMGPFRFLPMQCSHSVVSMGHSLTGGFTVEGQQLDLNGGIGYIEGDRGRSFPKQYLWLHCNDFPESCSIMASVADIPFAGFRFMGCICAIFYGGKEYRLATYHGVKIRCACKEKLILEQGRYRFEADISSRLSHPLKSPIQGRMVGTIHESNCTQARFRFLENDRMIFDLIGENTSFECNL